MRTYHSHTLLYLHETIALGSGSSDQFAQAFTDVYQPMMRELGARLFALWEATSYNGHWPQVTDHLGDRRVRRLCADRLGTGARRQPPRGCRDMGGVSRRHRGNW